MIVKWAKRTLPRPLVARIRRTLKFGLQDAWDTLAGRRDPLIPPRRFIFVGAGEFRKIGDEITANLDRLGLLRPEAAILDVGCGIGRIARPLTAYLSPEGRYEGLDIDRIGVDWCQRNITPRFANFRFQMADIHNKYYHPGGRWKASEYRFPYADAQFDLVILTSVFTHMFPADVDNYLSQIARVLKPGGRAYITYFLWNPEAEALGAQGKTHFAFPYQLDGFRSSEEAVPEQGIALPEDFVRGLHAKHGLTIETPVHYGKWRGRGEGMDFQDVMVARK
jgi:SAM-dependent methyltransferase